MNKDNLFTEIYERRLLIFLEDDNYETFQQVLVTPEQFKQISDIIFRFEKSEADGFEIGYINIDTDNSLNANLFEGMSSIEVDDDDEKA